MMSAPYMQSMFSTLQQNPEQAASMMQGAFASNPQLQQQVCITLNYCILQHQSEFKDIEVNEKKNFATSIYIKL